MHGSPRGESIRRDRPSLKRHSGGTFLEISSPMVLIILARFRLLKLQMKDEIGYHFFSSERYFR